MNQDVEIEKAITDTVCYCKACLKYKCTILDCGQKFFQTKFLSQSTHFYLVSSCRKCLGNGQTVPYIQEAFENRDHRELANLQILDYPTGCIPKHHPVQNSE